MLNYVRKGEIVYFLQTYDKNGKPKIECYTLDEFIRIPQGKNDDIGFGKLSITADNIIHLQKGHVDREHLDKYKESRKNNLLKLMMC